MIYACTALIALNKIQRYRLELIQNYCLCYARKAADSTCISNDELCSRCNILSVEQRVLALANNWWQKASGNKDDIAKQIPTQKPLFIKCNRFLHNHKPFLFTCLNITFQVFSCFWLLAQALLFFCKASLNFLLSS